MWENLEIYLYNESVKVAFLLWDTLQDIANEIGANLDETIPWRKAGQAGRTLIDRNFYLVNRFHSINQKRMEENIPRYLTTKQELLEDHRKIGLMSLNKDEWDQKHDEWREKLGIGPYATYLNWSNHKYDKRI